MRVTSRRCWLILTTPLLLWGSTVAEAQTGAPGDIVRHVEVRRTTHGVPHIRADNLEAAAYALAYVQ
ncbi:MAG: penicillin acylase family protein, partial [Gemmatimonadaceae bacterium]